jgi:Flp pilus assembly protein TadD
VRAPAAIAAAEGTIFQLDVSADGTTVLTVVEGHLDFYNEFGGVTVIESQQSTAAPGAAPTRPIVVDPSGFVAWEANLQTLIIDLEYPQLGADPDELERELALQQRVLEQQPNDPDAHVAVTRVLLDLGRTEEAQARAQRAVELAAADGAGLLGYVLLQAGRPSEARAQFATAAEAAPDEARWQLGLGLVALGQRDSEPAMALLQSAAGMAPSDPLPQAYLAAAHLRAGDLEAADAAASEAVRLGPDDFLPNTYLTYVRLAQGRVDEAVLAGTTAVAAGPGSALAHQALGTAQFFAGDLEDARHSLARAVELNPASSCTHLTIAKLRAAEDEIEGALDEAQTAVSLNPESAPARSTLGLLYLLNNDPSRAGSAFRTALELDPSLSEAHTGWGTVLARRGRLRESVNQQEAALALDTDSASAYNNLGGVYASLGEMDGATAEFQRAIDLQPGWGMPYANLALVRLEQNRFREALDAGEKAVKLGEKSPFLHTVLGRIYNEQGRTDRALAELRQAIALDDSFPQARFQLARLYLVDDRARDAVREILGALTTDPSAMLEFRRYARTENTASGGSDSAMHFDARHSDSAAEGRMNLFVSGQVDDSGGFRAVNQDGSEQFLEIIGGHQADPTEQLVFFGTFLNRTNGLPGPVAAIDPDDRQDFTGYEAVLAHRRRASREVTVTTKYSFRRGLLRFRNTGGALSAATDPFLTLSNTEEQHSPEVRVDADVSDKDSISAGFSASWIDTDRHGMASAFDPGTGGMAYSPFSTRGTSTIITGWIEGRRRFSDKFSLLAGGYLGRETDASTVLLPKVVAVYRPDKTTWVSLIANPIFRSDAAELAPVEALADPSGLGFLNLAEGGAARSYELRYQKMAGRSRTITASVSHQRVRGLLVDLQDPGLTALPTREIIGRGHRWVADAAYEQWLSDNVTGRLFARWQDTSGDYLENGVTGTEWPYAPNWQGGGRVDYIDANGVRIGLDAIWVGERFGDAENTIIVDDYPLVNLRVRFQRNLHQDYFLNITNVAGRGYETFASFPQAGRSIMAGVEHRY